MNMRYIAALAAVFACVFFVEPMSGATPDAPSVVHTQSAWLPVSVRFPLARKLQGYFEVQPRFQKEDDNGPFSENIIRTGIGRPLGKHWSVFGG